MDYAIEMIAGLESDISRSTYDGIKGHDPESEAELTEWQKARVYLEKQKEQKPAEVCYGPKGDPDPAGVWKPSEEMRQNYIRKDALIERIKERLKLYNPNDPEEEIACRELQSIISWLDGKEAAE